MKKMNLKTVEELRTLFSFVPPNRLSSVITFLLIRYITSAPVSLLNVRIVEDIELLKRFLDKAADNE